MANNQYNSLFTALKDSGAEMRVNTPDELQTWMEKSEDNLQKVYGILQRLGVEDIGEDSKALGNWLGYSAKSTPTTTKPFNLQREMQNVKQSVNDFTQRSESQNAWMVDLTKYSTSPGAFMGKPMETYDFGKKEYITPYGQRTDNKTEAERKSQEYRIENTPLSEGEKAQNAVSQLEQSRKDIDLELKKRIEQLDAEAAKNAPKDFKTRMIDAFTSAEGGLASDNSPKQIDNALGDRIYGELSVAKRALDKANSVVKEAEHNAKGGFEGSFIAGVGRGVANKFFDVSTWDMGVTDTREMTYLMQALDAADKGLQLSPSQQRMLDAKALELAIDAYFGSQVGLGYKGGQITAEAIPFMIEMAVNPLSAVGKTAAAKLTRYAMKKYGKKALKNNSKKYLAARTGAYLMGSIPGAVGMATTTGALRSTANAMERMNGDIDMKYNEDGDIVYGGHTEGEPILKAIAKGVGNQAIENYSEILGEVPVMKWIGDVIGKGVSKVGGKVLPKDWYAKLNKVVNGVTNNDIVRTINNFEQKAQWHGTVGEYFEEVAGNILNATFIGDQKWDASKEGIFNLDNNIETLVGVSIMGGFFSTVKTGTYGYSVAKAKRSLNKADAEADALLGNKWESLRNRLDNASNAADELRLILTETNMTEEQQRAIGNYVGKKYYLQGTVMGDSKRKENQSEVEKAIEDNYNDAYNATQDTQYYAKQLEDARKKLVEIHGEDFARDVESDPVDALNRTGEGSLLSRSIIDYANAKARYDGAINRLSDDMEDEIDTSTQQIDSHTNRDTGMITPATLEDGAEGQAVYIVSGSVKLHENGAVNTSESDTTLVAQDANTGEVFFISPDRILNVGEITSAEDAKANAENSIRAKYINRSEQISNPNIQQYAKDSTVKVVLPDGNTANVRVWQSPTVANNNMVGIESEDGTAILDGKVSVTIPMQQLDSMVVTENSEDVSTSDNEYDEDGFPLVLSSNGSTTFGEIKIESGLNPAPIKLSLGNSKYGLIHIEKRHGNQIRNAGFISAVEFVEHVAKNYTQIKKGENSLGEDNGTYLLQVEDDHNNTLYIELSTDGSYWGVNSGGVFRKGYGSNKKEVWSASEVQNEQSVTDNTLRTVDNTDNPAVPNGNVSKTSESKVNDSLPTEQISADKSFTQNTEETIPNTEEATALQRVPKDANGEPIFEDVDADTAWDALVEYSEGDVATAKEIADAMVEEKKKALDKAQKLKFKGKTPAEMLASKNANAAELAKAQQEFEQWQRIANVEQRRKDAERSARESEARQRAVERAAQEAAERAAREETERIEREALNGVPEWHQDTPENARARGFRRFNGQKWERQEPLQGVVGKEVDVKFSSTDLPKGSVAVIEADQLQPSHIQGERNPLFFIEEAQPKNRTDDISKFTAKTIAEGIRPEEITGNATAYTGAPTVNTRGEVIQGNSRSDALRYLWDNSLKAQQDAYKQYLIDNAEQFGIDGAAVEKMQHPVLVNMLDVDDAEAIRLGQMTAQDTESGGIERIKAKNVAQKLGENMRQFANMLLRSEDEDASFSQLVDRNGVEVLKWLNDIGVITPTQYKSAFDSKGNITAEAKNDLSKVLYQAVFKGTNQQLEELFEKLPAKAQRAILSTAFRDLDSPYEQRMLGEIQASVRAYDELMRYEEFVNSKKMDEIIRALEAWKRQTALDDRFVTVVPADNYSNFALYLAAMYKASNYSQRTIATTFNDMYDLIQGTVKPDLFNLEPDNTPRTLAEAIKEVLKIDYKPAKNNVDYGNIGSNDVGFNNPTSETREHGSDGDVASGEPDEGGEEPADGGGRIAGNSSAEREIADNGTPFVVAANGTTTFGEITDDCGLQAAPIKLSEGYHDEATGKGNGLTHIEYNHGKQIRNAGFSSVEEFVSFVSENFDHDNIRVGKLREDGSQTFLIQVTNEHDNTLFIELSKDGSYWNVNSGGIFRRGYSNKKETVAKTEPQQPNNAVSSGSSLSEGEQSGNSTSEPNGKPTVSISSESKDSNSLPTEQISEEKSSTQDVADVSEDEKQIEKQSEKGASLPTEEQKAIGEALTGLLKNAGIEVVTDAEEMRNALDDMSSPVERQSYVEEVSSHYKEQLNSFANGRMKSSDAFSLGSPSAILLSAGIPAKEIVMKQSVLRKHLEKHGLTIDDVRGLVDAIQKPLMVYEWGKKSPAHIVITDLSTADGRKITVAIKMDKEGNVHEVNEVASVHGKSIERMLKEMATENSDFFKDNLKYVDKEKALAWLTQPSPKEGSTSKQGFNQEQLTQPSPKEGSTSAQGFDVAKVIKDFENPKITMPIIEQLESPHGSTEFLKTSAGEVYGFVKDGKVYLDPSLVNPNTPIHEYTHLWDKALQKANPKLWQRGKKLMMQLPLWNEVKNDPAYASIANDEDLLASEVHSRLSGAKGVELLDNMVKDTGDLIEKAQNVALKRRIKRWLKDVLYWVRNAFSGKWSNTDIDKLTIDEFAAMPIKDLAKGVNPKAVTHRAEQLDKVVVTNPMTDNSLTEINKNNLLEAIDPIESGFDSKEVSDIKDKRLLSPLQINNAENAKKIKQATRTNNLAVERESLWENGEIANFAAEEVIEKIGDVFWDGTSANDRINAVKYLQATTEGRELIERLNHHSGTPWAKAAVNSVLVRMSLEDLLAGRKPRVQSMLTYPDKSGNAHSVVKLIERHGADGIWLYLTNKGIIGNAAKCVNNVNGSYMSCHPSDNCAKFCYASKGNSASTNSIVKNELIRYAVASDPKRIADMIARQYQAKGEWLNGHGKALRLFEAGDLDESWLPVIEELNRRGVVTQIFSKNPKDLEQVDRKKNVVMMSVDASNLQLLEEYPNLPVAFVYASKADLVALEKCRERFEKQGGVILPVVEGNRVLGSEELKQLPQWTHRFQCPIDNGQRKIVNKERPELSWNCTKCDAKGGVGCFFHRIAQQLKTKGYDLRRNGQGNGTETNIFGVASRNAKGVLGWDVSLSGATNSAGERDIRERILRTLRKFGVPDANCTPELLEALVVGLRGNVGSGDVHISNRGISERSAESASVYGRAESAGSGPERGSGIEFQILGEQGVTSLDASEEDSTDTIRFRVGDTLTEEEVSDVFDQQLERHSKEGFKKGEVYQLGKPSEKLIAAGFPANQPIEMSASHLDIKSKDKYHPFDIKELTGLVHALRNPLVVFPYRNASKSMNAIVELKHGEDNFLIGVHFGNEKEGKMIASIRGVFPKYNTEWLKWIENGNAIGVDKARLMPIVEEMREILSDKEKTENYMSNRLTRGDLTDINLDLVAKIINDFGKNKGEIVFDEIDNSSTIRFRDSEELNAESPLAERTDEQSKEKIQDVIDIAKRQVENPAEIRIITSRDDLRQALSELGNSDEEIEKVLGLTDETGALHMDNGTRISAGYLDGTDLIFIFKASKDSAKEYFYSYMHEELHHAIATNQECKEAMQSLEGCFDAISPELSQKVRRIYSDDSLETINEELVVYNIEQGLRNGNMSEIASQLPEDKKKYFERLLKSIGYDSAEKAISPKNISFIETRVHSSLGDRTRDRGGIQEKDKLEQRAAGLGERLGTKVRVITDVNDIVDDNPKTQQKKRNSKGWYDTRTGEVVVVVPNNLDVSDIERTVFHEIVAHKGLRELFGAKFNDFLDKVFRNASEEIRKQITVLAKENGWNTRVATEEFLAQMAEDTNYSVYASQSWFQQLWDAVKDAFVNLLSAMGIELDITADELRYTLWRSYQLQQNKGIMGEAENVVMQKRFGIGQFRNTEDVLEETNDRFNKELQNLTSENADSIRLYLGMPSDILKAAGISPLPMLLYGNKVIKKAAKHGFSPSNLKDLPRAVQHPIAIFEGNTPESHAILTELRIGENNILVSLKVGRGNDIDFNIITSAYGKSEDGVVNWINKGKLLYADKEKALNYLRIPAPIAGAQSNEELDSAANIIKNFENPIIETNESQEGFMFRSGSPTVRDRVAARDIYERRVKRGLYQAHEALQDSMLGLKEAMDAIIKASGEKLDIEDIPDFENPYLGENVLSSVSQAETEAFDRLLLQPLFKEVSKFAKNEKEKFELIDYMIAKHGLERNELMAHRDAVNSIKDSIEATDLAKAEKNYNRNPNPMTLAVLVRAQNIYNRILNIEYNNFRKRDYAGLTALTGEKDTADAERKAADMVKDYENTHRTINLWDCINAVSDAILDKCLESGLMSRKQYDSIKSMYTFYIPLRGFDAETSEDVYAYLNHKDGAFNAANRKAMGRTSKADDPLAYLQDMAEGVILQGNRNKLVKQRMLNFALNHPSDLVSVNDIWLQHNDVTDEWEPVFPDNINPDDTPTEVEKKMKDFEDKMRTLAKANPTKYKHGADTEDIPYRVVQNADEHQHQVIVKRNGKTVILTINGNPRAAQALNGRTNPDVKTDSAAMRVVDKVGEVNRVLASVYTTLNPDFLVSNFLRDTLYSNSMVWVKENPAYAMKFNKNWAKYNTVWMKRLFAKYNDGTLDLSDKTQRLFYQFMENGGKTGYARKLDIEEQKKKIVKAIKGNNQKLKSSVAVNAIGSWLSEVGDSIENRARFAAFVTSLESGRSIGRAVWDSKEITVNFNKKGAGDKFLGQTGQTTLGNTSALISGLGRAGYIFWNASLQGLYNFSKPARKHPIKFAALASSLFGLGFFIAALGSHDDDDEKGYFTLPKYTRRNNLCIPVGDGNFITIPIGVEHRALFGLGELFGSAAFHKDEIEANDVLSQLSQMMPIDVLEGQKEGDFKWWKPLIPSAPKAAIEAEMNTNWTGVALYNESDFMKNEPEWQKAYSSTNKYVINVCAALNEATGGNAHKKGSIDLNPAKIDYLLGSYAGVFYKLPKQIFSLTEIFSGERDFNPRELPIMNRVWKKGDERTKYRSLNADYRKMSKKYDALRDELNGFKRDYKNGKLEDTSYITNIVESPEYETMQQYEEIKKAISKVNQALKSENYTEEERKELEDLVITLKRKAVEISNTDK